jgi:hypothetical protein
MTLLDNMNILLFWKIPVLENALEYNFLYVLILSNYNNDQVKEWGGEECI